MHEAAYHELGLNSRFVFCRARVHSENLAMAIDGVRALGIRGVSVTMPHKIAVMDYLDELDIAAKSIGAVNTIVNENGKLKGYNTDFRGVVDPIREIIDVKDREVLILGAGGASRAAIYGLVSSGAKVSICNRSQDKAFELSEEFGVNLHFELKDIGKFSAIVNMTSVGMAPNTDSLITQEALNADQLVFDAVYNPLETKMLEYARSKGCSCISGIEMLVYQGLEQFRLYTGCESQPEIMRKAVLEVLG